VHWILGKADSLGLTLRQVKQLEEVSVKSQAEQDRVPDGSHETARAGGGSR